MTSRDAQPLLDEQAAERLLTRPTGSADPDLEQSLALVRTLGDGPAPPPSAALADLLDRGFQPTVVPFRRPTRRRRWAARTGATLATTAASLVVAGTAAALPPGLQDAVADVVSALTPFELPRQESGERGPDPAGSVPAGDAPRSHAPRTSTVPTPPAPATAVGSPETERADGASDGASAGASAPKADRQQPAQESQPATDQPREPAEQPAGTAGTGPEQPTRSVEQEPPRPTRP